MEKNSVQVNLEEGFKEFEKWFYHPFPPALIISEDHPAYNKILDLLDGEKSDE